MIHKLLSKLRRSPGQFVATQPLRTATDLEQVSKCWDETIARREAGKMLGWIDSPLVLEMYVLPAISGPDDQGNWFLDIANELNIRRDGHWLSPGCGSGAQKIFCMEQGLCSRMDAYDVSTEAVAIAKNKASQKGLSNLHFRIGDFNTLELQSDHYDAAIMSMSLHHVTKLNKLLVRVNRALKPDGWFLVNEYVGPSQF
jgi:SAM-dependent methyltransferase